MKIAILVFSTLVAQSAWSINLKSMTACKPLMDACMQAGKQGKEATTCVDSLKKGEAPKDVKVTPDQVKTCLASTKK